MNNIDKILDVVTKNPGLTAIEIANIIFGPNARQQQVNALLVALCNNRSIWRDTGRPYRYFPKKSMSGKIPAHLIIPGSKSPPSESLTTTIAALRDKSEKRTLFIIPCCAKKIPGGQPLPAGNHPAAGFPLVNQRAMALALAQPSNNPVAGNEFGLPPPANPEYQQAFNRYNGVLYGVPGVRGLLNPPRDNIIIMSALYGLLRTDDWIQDYDLQMGTTGLAPIWGPVLPPFIDAYANQIGATVIIGIFGRATAYMRLFSRLQNIPGIPAYAVNPIAGNQHAIKTGMGYALMHLAAGLPLPAEVNIQFHRIR